jgi:hypothetical protein
MRTMTLHGSNSLIAAAAAGEHEKAWLGTEELSHAIQKDGIRISKHEPDIVGRDR